MVKNAGIANYLDLQGGPTVRDPVGEGFSRECAIDPEIPEPLESAHRRLQQSRRPVAPVRVGRHHHLAEHKAKGVY